MKCIVVGGAGFIGSNLVDRLVDDGHEVLVIDDRSTGKLENINKKAEWYNHDISCMTDFSMFEGVDVVFHLAARAGVRQSFLDPVSYIKDNAIGTTNVANFVKECKLEEKSRSIDLALHNIYQVIVLFKIELSKIHKTILEHKKKMFSNVRKPNCKYSIERLKMFSFL